MMLLWLNAAGAYRLLADVQKLADSVPELSQSPKTFIG
jgi:hypothetical protein